MQKIKKQKWPAKVGYATYKYGLWYECWNDGSFRPTLWTRIILLLPKVFQKKYMQK